MENELKFSSQICTSREQSECLLDLGLKPETADCVITSLGFGNRVIWTETPIVVMEGFKSKRIPCYPAWSLHRLIEIAEVSVEVGGLFVRISSTYYYEEKDNVYDNLIDAISELIKNEVFNKEYLKQ